MVDTERRLGYIDIYRQGAEHWKAKGSRSREASSIDSLLMNMLAVAVSKYSSAPEAAAWLVQEGIHDYWSRHLTLLEVMFSELLQGERPASSMAGGYTHLAQSAFAWALGDDETGERYVRLQADERILTLDTPFWREYCRAVQSLIDGHAYEPATLKTRSYENFWVAYLELIACLTRQDDASDAVAEVDHMFHKRNTDKRLKTDAYEVEGSPTAQVSWDFRRDGLLAYAARAVAKDDANGGSAADGQPSNTASP